MTAHPLNAAIVGLGRWGQNLARAAQSPACPTLQITQAMTRTPDKATDFCTELGLHLRREFDEVLEDPDVQAVILATPHSQHVPQICAAATAGKHVFVEKPLALSLAEADRAYAACEAADVCLCVGFNRRYLPAFSALKSLIDTGQLGKILQIEGNFSGPFGYDYTNEMWRGTAAENPAGGMAAMGIHILDAMIALLGPVQDVRTLSQQSVLENGLNDTTQVQMRFRSGAIGGLSTLMATSSLWHLRVLGSNGWAEIVDQTELIHRDLDGKTSRQQFDPVDTLALELEAFAQSVKAKVPFAVTRAQARAGVAAMAAISASALNGGGVEQVTPT